MKFTLTLTKGHHVTIERDAKWILDFSTKLDAQKTSLDEGRLALEAAKSRKGKAEKDAARNHAAALALAGAEAQISLLTPQVKQLQQALDRNTATAIHQINCVWSDDVREIVYGPFTEQLLAFVATTIRPLFDSDWARQFAKQIAPRTNQYRPLMSFLNRPPLDLMMEFEEAKREINAFVVELQTLLEGGTILEV